MNYQRQYEKLRRIQEVSRVIMSEHNLRGILDMIMDTLIEITEAERGFLILREKEELVVKAARNMDREAIRRPEGKLSRTIAYEAFHSGEPVVIGEAQEDERVSEARSVVDLKLKSVIAAPFQSRGKTIGALYLDNRFVSDFFTDEHLDLLEVFAGQAAVAIENATLHEENVNKAKELQAYAEKVEKLNEQLTIQVKDKSEELRVAMKKLAETENMEDLKYSYKNIIGGSKKMREVFGLLDKVTDTSLTVNIFGESGTGKELVARAIHFNGPRKKERFVSENCASIPETLLESELFGYVKGAFTGADKDKTGLFREADGGTLFLDEVGDMPESLQSKMLRVLETSEVRPVGSEKTYKVDVRLITASNKDLGRLVQEKKFREDLFYRLNVFTINLPTLKERREDIPALAEHFMSRACRVFGKEPKRLDDSALAELVSYHWPGNVRELKNFMENLVVLVQDEVIRACDVEFKDTTVSAPDGKWDEIVQMPYNDAKDEFQRQYFKEVLARNDMNVTRAAEDVGLIRQSFQRILRKHNIRVKGYFEDE